MPAAITVRNAIEYALFLLLTWVVKILPIRAVDGLGARLGWLAFSVLRFRRTITLDNLRRAFPSMSQNELVGIARGAYRNYGITLAEMLWSGGVGERELMGRVHVQNPGIAKELLKRGKGLIVLSAHFGGWEFLVTALRLHLEEPMVMIVQHQRNGLIDARVNERRSRFGNTTVPMGPSVREVLKALQQGKMVTILGDQSGPKEAIFVQFFGRPSATHRGVAAFSLKTGCPIMLTLLVRQEDGTYKAEFEEIDREGLSGSTEEKIVELTRRHTEVLEKHIRRHPDQWLWMHKRWKHTPYYESLQPELPGQAARGEGG